MATPVEWIVVALMVDLVSGLYQAGTAYTQGKKNAAYAQADIDWVEQQTAKEESRFREQGKGFLGTQSAVVGMSAAKYAGSPLMIKNKTAAQIEEDALQIRLSGQHEIDRLKIEKKGYEDFAKQAFIGGLVGMGSTFLTGYKQIYRPKTNYPTFYNASKPSYRPYEYNPSNIFGY